MKDNNKEKNSSPFLMTSNSSRELQSLSWDITFLDANA